MSIRERLEGKVGIAAAVVLVLCIGVGVWALVKPSANTPDAPDGLYYVCKAGHSFNMTMKQVSDYQREHYGEPIACRECGSKETERANKCAKCGEVYPMARGEQPPCPKCGTKPVPPG
jgi:ribosomal protein L40E